MSMPGGPDFQKKTRSKVEKTRSKVEVRPSTSLKIITCAALLLLGRQRHDTSGGQRSPVTRQPAPPIRAKHGLFDLVEGRGAAAGGTSGRLIGIAARGVACSAVLNLTTFPDPMILRWRTTSLNSNANGSTGFTPT
eukprot:6206819-Pleurochrysis_carterae.AAC.3